MLPLHPEDLLYIAWHLPHSCREPLTFGHTCSAGPHPYHRLFTPTHPYPPLFTPCHPYHPLIHPCHFLSTPYPPLPPPIQPPSPPDDLLYTWLVLLNQYQVTVPEVANTTKGSDLASIVCMVQHCSRQIMDCVGDATCKAGLDCLQACAFNDQVRGGGGLGRGMEGEREGRGKSMQGSRVHQVGRDATGGGTHWVGEEPVGNRCSWVTAVGWLADGVAYVCGRLYTSGMCPLWQVPGPSPLALRLLCPPLSFHSAPLVWWCVRLVSPPRCASTAAL